MINLRRAKRVHRIRIACVTFLVLSSSTRHELKVTWLVASHLLSSALKEVASIRYEYRDIAFCVVSKTHIWTFMLGLRQWRGNAPTDSGDWKSVGQIPSPRRSRAQSQHGSHTPLCRQLFIILIDTHHSAYSHSLINSETETERERDQTVTLHCAQKWKRQKRKRKKKKTDKQ